MKTTTLLAIESSCDETGVSVVRKEQENITVLSELIASQADIHKETGGVVPEVAAREHLAVIGPMIKSAMEKAKVDKDSIDGIAVTVGPGLMPALAVGVQAAKTLAFAWNKPIVPVHHIEGHIYSALLQANAANEAISSTMPALGLIVSGGHTMLIEITGNLQYRVLGQTRDDAVGEVFDKVARMLQLPYPGGPNVSALAKKGNKEEFAFPRPMMHSGDLDFSYSGLKTAVLYQVQDIGEKAPFDRFDKLTVNKFRVPEKVRANIAASFEAAVVDSLIGKLVQAMKQKQYRTILLAGGVAANESLRTRMKSEADAMEVALQIAPQALCGDNATMIGQAGVFAYEAGLPAGQAGRTKNWKDIDASARINIEEFSIS